MAAASSGRGGLGRKESAAIFVAVLGIIGSVATLIISDVLDDARRARLEEETALIQLDRSIVGWEKRAVTPTVEKISDQWLLNEKARKASRAEREQLERSDWRYGWEGIRTQMDAAEEQFDDVRQAYEAALRETEGVNYDAVQTYYGSARVRMLSMFYARDLVPREIGSRPSKAETAAYERLAEQLRVSYRFSAPKDVTGYRCPEHGTWLDELDEDEYADAMISSIDCLEATHSWYADQIRPSIRE